MRGVSAAQAVRRTFSKPNPISVLLRGTPCVGRCLGLGLFSSTRQEHAALAPHGVQAHLGALGWTQAGKEPDRALPIGFPLAYPTEGDSAKSSVRSPAASGDVAVQLHLTPGDFCLHALIAGLSRNDVLTF